MLRKVALALALTLALTILALAAVSAESALAGGTAVEYGLMWDW